MRRLIAYIAMTAAMMVGVGAATGPALLSLDGDLSYADGQTLYFKVGKYSPDSENGNYGDFLDETSVYQNEHVVDAVADVMRSRLDGYGVTGYQIEVQGYDTLAVSLRLASNSSTQYGYISDILSFSGQDYELDASDVTGEGENSYQHNVKWEDIIDGQTAWVQDIEISNTSYTVPMVIVPLKEGDEYKQAFLGLLEYIGKLNDAADDKAEEGDDTSGDSANLVIWANRTETDTIDSAFGTNGQEANPNVSKKIVGQWSVSNDACVYYQDSDSDKTTPYLKLAPMLSGSYDPSKAQEAYDSAFYMCQKLNASSYSFDNVDYQVTYTYSQRSTASVENLTTLGWQKSVSLSRTLISIVAVAVVLAIVLSLMERIAVLTHLSSAAVSTLGSLAMFSALGAQFNIAALIGLGAVAMVSLFGSLFYSSRFKEEIYKGRTLKKANVEAGRRSLVPTIDAGIISVILGVFLYILGGDVAMKAGVMLVIGGVATTVVNLVFTRIGFWLFANDSSTQASFPKLLGVNKTKVPNLLKEEKQSYFGAYADKDFSKGKRVMSIFSGVCLLAGIVTMIVFGSINNGSVYNDASYRTNEMVLRIDVQANSEKEVSVIGFEDAGNIYNPNASSTNPTDTLHKYTIDGKNLGDLIASSEDFTVSADPKAVYTDEGGSIVTTYWYYYEAKLSKVLSTEKADYEFGVWNGTSYAASGTGALEDFAQLIAANGDINKVVVNFAVVTAEELTPYLSDIALGVGIGLAVVLVYMLARYGLSRGFVATLIATASSYLAVAFFVFTRISTGPVVALGAILAALLALLASLFILNGEKDIAKENKDREKSAFEIKSEALLASSSRQAQNLFVFGLAMLWVCILCFAVGPTAFQMPYLAGVVGGFFAIAMLLTLLPSGSILLAKLLGKIKFKPLAKKKKNKGGEMMKKKAKGGEAEEAIFIGIND